LHHAAQGGHESRLRTVDVVVEVAIASARKFAYVGFPLVEASSWRGVEWWLV
jgi:hypothetical protein